MKQTSGQKKYFYLSFCTHVIVFALLMLGFDYTAPLAVLENTDKQDVISAVVLGDSPDSKLLPQLSKPIETPKEETKSAEITPAKPNETKNELIALKAPDDKKQAEKKRREKWAENLLADIEQVKQKKKLVKPQKVKTKFDQALHEQAEKSLREQLLNEEIKLQSTVSRQTQGEINKYKALILQVISEKWVIPTQANKKLTCELMIRTAPGGVVLDVQVTKASGDPSLDRSARAAVLNASPLPVPKDSAAFDAFRQFVLKVKPENILNESRAG